MNKGPPGNLNNRELQKEKEKLEKELVNYEKQKEEMIEKYYNMLDELNAFNNINEPTQQQLNNMRLLQKQAENLNTAIVKYVHDMIKYKQLVKNYF